MATNSKIKAQGGKDMAHPQRQARSIVFAAAGIRTGEDFANTMSALMTDLLEGTITPQVGNAVCNAGGKLLKIVEMQYKYAHPPQVIETRPNIVLAAPLKE